MRTPEKNYDRKPDFGTLVQKHRLLPFKAFADIITAKVDDLTDMLKRPTPFDQGPGKSIPYGVGCLYGPLPLTTPRRYGDAGFEAQATLASDATFYVPREGDILIDREFSFRCWSMQAFGFVNWGYTEDPMDFDVPTENPAGVGDIFDPVTSGTTGPNGGAIPLDFFDSSFSTYSVPFPDVPNICFEVELYDRLRGKRMHNNRLPSQMFQGGRMANVPRGSPLVFPQGSKIEPRLFVKEIRMGSVLDGGTAYDAASVKVWLSIVFKGEQLIEIP